VLLPHLLHPPQYHTPDSQIKLASTILWEEWADTQTLRRVRRNKCTVLGGEGERES